MMWQDLTLWYELIVLVLVLSLSIYVLSINEIKQLQKIYVSFHVSMILWPLGQVSINVTDDPAYQWVYLNISFIGIILISYLWLLISLQFSLVYRLRKFFLRLAAIPPIIIAICVTLNPVFHWFVRPVNGSFLYREYGPIFILFVCVAAVYVFVGIMLLALTIRAREGSMRKKAILLCIGQIVLLIFGVTDAVLNWNSADDMVIYRGLTSAGMLVSYFFFFVAAQNYSPYKVISLAHDAVIESMDSGLVVLSDRNIVIDMNQTARRFTSAKMGQPFPIEDCLSCMDPRDAEDFLYVYTNKPRSSIQAELNTFIPTMKHVLMRIHPILHRNQRFLGRIITFQDVTEWRSLVEELNSKNLDLQMRNEELTLIQDELSTANKKLELLATTDSLTGCYNRRYLMQMMEYQITVDKRYRVPFSFILLDIDYFKQTNDTYGHQAGDQVLKQTVDLISSRLRQTDIFARYGGEEFAIFLPHTKREYAVKLAEELRLLVENNTMDTGLGEVRITISIGIASSDDTDYDRTVDVKSYIVDLIARADAALYRAKNQGRNRIAASE
jgi:diguanylate cyclase (GGDEF)-like protein